MADLDTTSKRRSSVQLVKPFVMAPPHPDGTLGQGDRQHIAQSYSGIAAAGGSSIVVLAMHHMRQQGMA